jgi:signal transduction histidine kinase
MEPTEIALPPRPSELSAEQRQAAWMRTLVQLAPGIAHDLRAPINTMVFTLEVLREAVLRRGGPPEAVRPLLRHAEALREELGRLHQRLEGLLACLLPAPTRSTACAPGEILGEIAELVRPTARKRQVTVELAVPLPSPELTADPRELLQALLHLAPLALAATETRGTFTLAAAETPSGLLVQLCGSPPRGEAEARDPAADRLAEQAAGTLLARQGGELRNIDNSASNELTGGYEIEFLHARNSGPTEER